MKAASFPTLLERFFLQRLIRQRQVSPHTVSSYRDTFRLLLQFAKRRLWFISVIARKPRRSWRHQISSPGTRPLFGKGRRERITPLTKQIVVALKAWQQNLAKNSEWLFPTARGSRLSSDAVQRLLAKYKLIACRACPSLKKKRVTPHVLRHTLAMELLQAGIDRSVIALWLGHESVETTQIYLDANLALKEKALAKTTQPGGVCRLFKPDESLLAFLKTL